MSRSALRSHSEEPLGRFASERDIDFNGVYRVTPDGALTPVVTDLEIPNADLEKAGEIINERTVAGERWTTCLSNGCGEASSTKKST